MAYEVVFRAIFLVNQLQANDKQWDVMIQGAQNEKKKIQALKFSVKMYLHFDDRAYMHR